MWLFTRATPGLNSPASLDADAEPPPIVGERNPIIEWILAQPLSCAELHDRCDRLGADLAERAKPLGLDLTDRKRLAAAVFLEFAGDQGLSPGELTMLMRRGKQHAMAAAAFLERQSGGSASAGTKKLAGVENLAAVEKQG